MLRIVVYRVTERFKLVCYVYLTENFYFKPMTEAKKKALHSHFGHELFGHGVDTQWKGTI